LDYYLIDIQGYITTLASSAQAAVNDCYAGLTQFCPLITRDSSGAITVVNLGEVNIGHLRTSGENIEASYRIDLSGLAPSLGTLGVRALTTHLDNYYLNNSIIAGGLNTAINAGADFPRWKGSIEGIYQKGAFTFGLVGRYIADNIMTNAYAGNLLSNYDVANVFYLDGSVAYKMPFGIELYAVSNNLFNRAPPADGALSSLAFLDVGTSAGLYDTIGRTVRIGIRGKF
jgi:prepilin-type processing-associated H-X9-DG protein